MLDQFIRVTYDDKLWYIDRSLPHNSQLKIDHEWWSSSDEISSNFLTLNFIRQVQKVHIGHDSKGRNKGVFVEEIEVTAPDAPKVIFPCRCWLAENEDDGKTARVIVPGESVTQPYDSKW